MEEILKRELDLSSIKATGQGGGGCINSGRVYDTENGKIYVKENPKSGARVMFQGELDGLQAIQQTGTIRVPKSFKVINLPQGGAVLVMEYLDMKSLNKFQKELGRKMAELHLSNRRNEMENQTNASFIGREKMPVVEQFGFKSTTCCGYLPLDNEWSDDWVTFYARNRLKPQLDIVQSNYHDQEASKLWPQVERNLPKLFPPSIEIKPSLLHGDLWGGNAAELENEPCVFDPATFYGHSEFELAIAHMFGGFSSSFFNEYHNLIPKSPGFEMRLQAYQLFHYLNHWNHFGSGYRGASISLLKTIAKL